MRKILLVSTKIDSPSYSDRPKVMSILKDYMSDIDADIDIALLEDMTYSIIDNVPRIVTDQGVDVVEYDLVYIKNWRAVETSATALTIYLESSQRKVICSELKHFRATDKIAEAFLLAANKVPYPDTLFTIQSNKLPIAMKESEVFKYPLVVKAVNGSAGEDNYLARTSEEFESILAENPTLQFMVQNMIENDGDHRILVLGYEPKLSFKRSRVDDSTHLNNTSQGASAILTNLNEYGQEILDDCVKASRLVRREIAGVDVLIDSRNGRHVVLEVNASPQLSTGAFLEEKRTIVNEFFKKELEDA